MKCLAQCVLGGLLVSVLGGLGGCHHTDPGDLDATAITDAAVGGMCDNDAGVGDGGGDSGPAVACGAPSVRPGTGRRFCDIAEATPDPRVVVPAGFCVRRFAVVREARVLRFAPNGDLFVAAPSYATPGGAAGGPGAILVLPDDNHDGRADNATLYAGNLPDVHGLLFSDGYLYFTRSDEVRRFRYCLGDRGSPLGAGEQVATLGEEAIGST